MTNGNFREPDPTARPHLPPHEDAWTTTWNTRLTQSINVAGSLASLTGISLLWLKSTAPNGNLAVAVPVYLIASMFTVGVIAVAWLLGRGGYIFLFDDYADTHTLVVLKLAYGSIVGGILLMFLWMALSAIFLLAGQAIQNPPS